MSKITIFSPPSDFSIKEKSVSLETICAAPCIPVTDFPPLCLYYYKCTNLAIIRRKKEILNVSSPICCDEVQVCLITKTNWASWQMEINISF